MTFSEKIDQFLFNFISNIGLWWAFVAPALVFAFGMYLSLAPMMGHWFAAAAGSSAGIAIIVAERQAAHNVAVRGGRLAWAILLGSVLLEITGLWLADPTETLIIGKLGTVITLLTVSVYVSKSMMYVTEEERTLELEERKEDRTFRKQRLLKKDEMTHEEKLAEVQASNGTDGHSNGSKKPSTDPEKENALLSRYREDPRASIMDVAKAMGVSSKQTVYTYRNKLAAEGRIEVNGKGVIIKDD